MPVKRTGFTLIEVLLVIIIIAILATIAIPQMIGYFAKGHDATKQINIQRTSRAVLTYSSANQADSFTQDLSQLKVILDINGIDPFYETSGSCYVYGVNPDGGDFFVAVESQQEPDTFYFDGSNLGRPVFDAELGLKTQLTECGALTSPTETHGYNVFYIQ